MISSGINLVMTVIGFAVSTMFIVFVCTRLVCARIHFNASRRSFPIASRSDLSVLERGYHGLEPVVVANFPTKKYTDQYFSAAEISQCTVCLSEYNREDVLRILPFCGHSFHVMCIDTWLQQHSTCPVCRISLREIPDRKRLMRPLFSSANRSQYTNRHAYPCVLTHHGCSSTNHDSYGMMDPIQEDRFVPEGDEEEHSGENNNVSGFDDEDNDNRIRKESGNKNVDSPSNA